MFKVYFGEWGSGRLRRMQYLGYYLLLMLLVIVIFAGAIFSVGAFENMAGGDIATMQQTLLSKLGIPLVIGMVIVMFGTMIAQVNILAKRIRDMGLPALWTILGLIAVSIVLGILFPGETVQVAAAATQSADGNVTTAALSATHTQQSIVTQIYDTVIFFALLLIPSDTFGKGDR